MNLLKDPTFEKEFNESVKGKIAYEVLGKDTVNIVETMNVFPLEDWDFFYVDAPGLTAPEMRDAWKNQDPNRVRAGGKALVCHVSDRYHAGWMQTVDIPNYGPVTFFAETYNLWMFRNSDTYIDDAALILENGKLKASVWMHAWSNHNVPGFFHVGKGNCSVGVNCGPVAIREGNADKWVEENIPNSTKEMKDAVPNFTFGVGIDLTGGKNPLADSVQWGERWHVYNGYCQKISCEVTLDEEEPEPDPEPPEPEPDPDMSEMSKIGPHVIRAASKLQDYLNAKPAVVKFIGDYYMPVPEGTLVIGRKYDDPAFNANESMIAGDNPKECAQWWVNELQISTYLANPHITYWEGPNEQNVWEAKGIGPRVGMRWFAEFEAERVRALDQIGRKAVIGNFATGTPPLDLWPDFLEAIRVGLKYQAILGLHEYGHPWMWWMTGKYQLDPNEDQGNEGWTTLRYRKAYRQYLLPRGLQIPLVITESGIDALVNPKPPGTPTAQWKGLGNFWKDNHDGPIPYPEDRDEYYAQQLIWYDKELRKDPYVIGHTLYCWGNYGGEWEKFDVAPTNVPHTLTEYIMTAQENVPFEYETYSGELPEEGYDRLVLVVDYGFIQDPEKRLDYYIEAADRGITVSPSWDDARRRPPGAKTNTIEAPGIPLEHQAAHRDFVYEQDPEAKVVFRDTPDQPDPPEIELHDVSEDLPLNPKSPWWPWRKRTMDQITHVFVHHTAGAPTSSFDSILSIAKLHISDTPRWNRPGICYTWMIGADGKAWRVSDEHNVVFAQGSVNRPGDENVYGLAICLMGNFTGGKNPTAEQMKTLESLISYADSITPNNIEVWGHKDVSPTKCPGDNWPWKEGWGPNPQEPLLIGMHDEPGGEWLKEKNLEGCCLVLAQIQRHGRVLDMRHLNNPVIARVDWGYADGSGSLPLPGYANAWVDAVVNTINSSKGICGWIIGNEVNNPAEWPGSYPNPYLVVSPEYYIDLYNCIVDKVEAPIAPFAIDPYNVVAQEFGQPGDPKEWARRVYANANRYDFIALHAKTQTNAPQECWSSAVFSHPPLVGRFHHLRTIEDQLSWVPEKRTAYITELNPQLRSDGTMGWEKNNAEWIPEALSYVRTIPEVRGVMFYRYELAGGGQEGFALCNKPTILDAIERECV